MRLRKSIGPGQRKFVPNVECRVAALGPEIECILRPPRIEEGAKELRCGVVDRV